MDEAQRTIDEEEIKELRSRVTEIRNELYGELTEFNQLAELRAQTNLQLRILEVLLDIRAERK